MKVALLINRGNFEKYSNWTDAGWEITHFGNIDPDMDKVTASGAEAMVVDPMIKIGPEIISKMPKLKIMISHGVAYNNFDLASAKATGVYVCNNAGVNAQPVAEQTLLLILALLKKFRYHEDMVYAGRQMEFKMSCFENGLTELGELKVGIVGYGAIGKALISIMRPFGCGLCYYTRSGDHGVEGAEYVPLTELYGCCDIVSLCLPVTPETEGMINADTLKMFKRGAILINTARGDLINNEDVAAALNSGQLGGFGADTIAPSPVQADNPLLVGLTEESRRRVAFSPHIGGSTKGCFTRVYKRIGANIKAIENGQRPDCIVNQL